MRKLTAACVAVATLAISPALAGDIFSWAGYAWRPTVSFRDYYAYHNGYAYPYYYPPAVAPDGRYWSRVYRRRWSWRR